MPKTAIRLTLGAMVLFGTSVGSVAQTMPSAPTYAKDVAPILFAKCVECHRAGEVAPMPLVTYDDARPWARAIKKKVLDREMPPWHADPRYGRFLNDRSLTDAERDTIARWADAGAPIGDPASIPPTPTFASGWQGGQPDHVFEMPEIPVAAEGELPNEYYWVPNPHTQDLLVEALELRPGNSSVVHHIRIDSVALPRGCTVVAAKLIGVDGTPCREPGGANDVINDRGDRYYLVAYVPGRGAERHPPGTAKRISAGHWIRFNIHFQPNGVATTDRSKLGVWLAKGKVTHEIFTRTAGQALPTDADITRLIAEGREITRDAADGRGGNNGSGRLPNIPPFADNWQLIGITPVTEPITLYALSPHMHLRGKDLKWVVTWPDGRDEVILNIPKYDFNWQLQYKLLTPLKLPAGSRITAIAHFDNSARNKYNPSPEKEVFWAEQSWDEMFSPFIEYTVESQNIAGAARTRTRQR
jgi:hypothetical protein